MTPREKRTVLLGLGVIAAALLLRGGLGPVYGTWRDARAAVSQHDEQLDTLESRLDRRDQRLRRLRAKYGPAVDAELVPVSEARMRFPDAAQQALQKGGLGVSSVALQGVRRSRELPGVSLVTLRVEGSVKGQQLPHVFAQLRGCTMLALIDDARLEKSQNGNEQQFAVSLVLSTPALTEADR